MAREARDGDLVEAGEAGLELTDDAARLRLPGRAADGFLVGLRSEDVRVPPDQLLGHLPQRIRAATVLRLLGRHHALGRGER